MSLQNFVPRRLPTIGATWLNYVDTNIAGDVRKWGASTTASAAVNTTAIQNAINFCAPRKYPVYFLGVFPCNGLTLPAGTTLIAFEKGHGLTGSGAISASVASVTDITIQGMSFFGAFRLLITGTAVSTRGSRITIRDVYNETSINDPAQYGVALNNLEQLTVNNLHVHLTAASGDTRGIGLGVVSDSNLEGLRVTGSVSMGIETYGGDVNNPSLHNTRIAGIHVDKDDTFTAQSGDHGVYLHGCVDCDFDGLFILGDWGASLFGFKFRQNLHCRIHNLYSREVRIASDTNANNWDTEHNTFTDVKCERFVLFADDFPTRNILENTVINLYVEDGLNAADFDALAVAGPVYISGNIYLEDVGDIRTQGCVFQNAVVTVPNMDDTTTRFTTGTDTDVFQAYNTHFTTDVYVYDQLFTMANCRLDGFLRHDSTPGTYTLRLSNCFIADYFFTNNSGSRTIEAFFYDVSFGANWDSNPANNPDVRNYYNVKFADRYFVTGYQLQPAESVTAANIADMTAAINTQDKVAGKLIWDSDNNRMMRADGAGATDVWWVVDGSASVTPV